MSKLNKILNKIRYEGLSDIEMYKIIKKFTSLEFEALKFLLNDINFYLNVEKVEFIDSLDPLAADERLKELKSKGLSDEYILNKYYIKSKKIDIVNGKIEATDDYYYLDHEALLFPFEFWNIYHFRRIALREIEKYEPGFDPNFTISLIPVKKQTTKEKPADDKNKNSAGTKNTQPSFENSISEENQKFILQLMAELSITKNGNCNVSARKKSSIRGLVVALKDAGKLPNLAIHDLCLIIGDKIGLEIKSKLEHTFEAKEMQKKVKNHLKTIK